MQRIHTVYVLGGRVEIYMDITSHYKDPYVVTNLDSIKFHKGFEHLLIEIPDDWSSSVEVLIWLRTFCQHTILGDERTQWAVHCFF